MSTLPLFDDPRSPGSGGKGEPPDDNKVYRVSQLNRAVRGLLEQRWGNVWVHGEISDLTLAASGHAYFTLNDEDEPAHLRVVLFRSDVQRSKAKLENGARVKLQGQLSLFTPRGSYQMIARIALPEGLGELHAQFERVRKKLETEGLVAAERKRPLPHLPRVLGVVTSLHGAALHDIIRVVQARSPTRIVISPCVVQGATATGSIVRALHRIQRLRGLDAVIVGRGGGAAEDLVAFNDERVARAIASCRVPVISAVGHEVDVTIADLVADVRAATPSNAAELAVPDRRALLSELLAAQRRLARAAEIWMGRARLRLAHGSRRLRDPRQVLRHTRTRLQTLDQRLRAQMRGHLRARRALLVQHSGQLTRSDPRQTLRETRSEINALWQRSPTLMRARLRAERSQLTSLWQRSPTLMRGRLRERQALLKQYETRLAICDPQRVLRQTRGHFAALEQRMHALVRARLRTERAALVAHNAQLALIDPRHMLAARRQRLSQLQSRLEAKGRALSHPGREQLARLAGQLMALSPLASLARGYAIVLHEPSGRALVRATDAQPGDGLQIRLHEGTLRARVETS
ncbi:MAG TPA: exodeoxyribonuclease VII large subunit [Polyangiales bacterium]|nr:exodeoxyribonuclease VII large subunit [Polyangiales bacterium]